MKGLDISARVFSQLYAIERFCLHSFYTIVGRLKFRLIGVSMGNNIQFNGPIRIERFKHSKILVGKNVTFNSLNVFNPRGCRLCILQTATDSAVIEIGNNCGFSGVSIVAWSSVKIGANSMIGANVSIGDTDDHPERLHTKVVPVNIGQHVFIGMNSIILKGVTIGDNAIIGAGSVVTKDIPANCVAAGVPCRVIHKGNL